MSLFVSLLYLLLVVEYGNAFMMRASITTSTSKKLSTINMNMVDEWSKERIPADMEAITSLMVKTMEENLSKASGKRLSIDVLTPGLNPKLEQKAMLFQDVLFDLVVATLPVFESKFVNVFFAFPSAGDAAGFQNYCAKNRVPIPDCITLSDVRMSRMDDSLDCVLFITTRNNVGDPVIKEVEKICTTYTDPMYLFLNCDLSDKVTTGMSQKGQRDAFRSTIKPIFHFRNIVRVLRPSLVPIEIGAITFLPSQGWVVSVVRDDDIVGPGSLNRFMKLPVFFRNQNDPTGYNPPNFAIAGKFDRSPNRVEMDSIMSRAAFLNAKYERDKEELKKRSKVSDAAVNARPLVDSTRKAIDALKRFKSASAPEVGQACVFIHDTGTDNDEMLSPAPTPALDLSDFLTGSLQPPSPSTTTTTTTSTSTSTTTTPTATAAPMRMGLLDLNDEAEAGGTLEVQEDLSDPIPNPIPNPVSVYSLSLPLTMERASAVITAKLVGEVVVEDSDLVPLQALTGNKVTRSAPAPFTSTTMQLFDNGVIVLESKLMGMTTQKAATSVPSFCEVYSLISWLPSPSPGGKNSPSPSKGLLVTRAKESLFKVQFRFWEVL